MNYVLFVAFLATLLTISGILIMSAPELFRGILNRLNNMLLLRGLSLLRLGLGIYLALVVAPAVAISAIVYLVGLLATILGAIGLCMSSERFERTYQSIVQADEKYLRALGSISFTLGLALYLSIVG